MVYPRLLCVSEYVYLLVPVVCGCVFDLAMVTLAFLLFVSSILITPAGSEASELLWDHCVCVCVCVCVFVCVRDRE